MITNPMNSIVQKPWGSYLILEQGKNYLVKNLLVKSGEKLSLQSHKHRSEHWVVVRGSAKVTIDDNIYNLEMNESIYIPLGSKHRLENRGEKDLIITEIQIGDYLDEEDIIRYEDIYGREVIT